MPFSGCTISISHLSGVRIWLIQHLSYKESIRFNQEFIANPQNLLSYLEVFTHTQVST